MDAVTWLLDLVFPPRCPACRLRTARVEICHDCLSTVAEPAGPVCTRCGLPLPLGGPQSCCGRCLRHPPAFARARACTTYRRTEQHPVVQVLQRVKYGREIACAGPLGDYLCRHLPALDRSDLIVPVPLHRRRLQWRGFNQSALLATRLARRRQVPLNVHALARRRATPAQVGLGEAQRRRNVAGAFVVRDPPAVRGKSVLLVDDVMTTGATVDECAQVLRRAGARCVDVLVLARALDHP